MTALQIALVLVMGMILGAVSLIGITLTIIIKHW